MNASSHPPPVPREAAVHAQRLAAGFPIVAITGPRQSGKTTLARALFPGKAYVSLEDLDQREFASSDPRGFLARFPDGAVFDEAQRAPGLFSYLQGVVDERRRMGDFVLTGSQQFGLRSGISQSLAGRVGLVELLPFSYRELAAVGRAPPDLDQWLWRGGYPPLYDRPVTPDLWFPNYVATYLERDLRQALAVRDLDLFQRFIKLCAARTGQLLNLSSLATDCGVAQSTAREWLGVLENSYVVTRLPPYYRNFGKRLVKTPKLYFLDAGLAAWLLGIRDAAALAIHAQRGALFETWVVSEFQKARCHAGRPSELYFWRDHVGHEVDLVWETADGLRAVEIKSGATFVGEWLAALRRWQAFAGEAASEPWLVYGGRDSFVRDGHRVLGWTEAAMAAQS
ncbi:MAG: ATP-binding protein [Gammaproteobacteria bacterium]